MKKEAHPIMKIVRRERLKKGLTLTDLSVLTGIDRAQLNKYELGYNIPSIDIGNVILEALGLQLSVVQLDVDSPHIWSLINSEL